MHAAAVWLRQVKESYGPRLEVIWRYFSLEQVNSQAGPRFKLWEQPDDFPSRGLWAFRAAEAARRQGEKAFNALHLTILKARHEEGKNIADRSTLLSLAEQAGLKMSVFSKDLADRSLLKRIGEDHLQGVTKHGVFGTPTLVFDGGTAAYLKMRPPPPPAEAVTVFENLRGIIVGRPNVLEVKRPVPPPPGQ